MFFWRSYGGFGGGLGGDITNFGDRFDFDAAAYWELRNLGHGEAAARDVARSRIDQARFRQIQIMDQVASEVAEPSQVLARRREIDSHKMAFVPQPVRTKKTCGIKDGQGLPLEVLQSLQALDQSQREYLRAIADYNEAQFDCSVPLGGRSKAANHMIACRKPANCKRINASNKSARVYGLQGRKQLYEPTTYSSVRRFGW